MESRSAYQKLNNSVEEEGKSSLLSNQFNNVDVITRLTQGPYESQGTQNSPAEGSKVLIEELNESMKMQ
jgi:hypothetical protein